MELIISANKTLDKSIQDYQAREKRITNLIVFNTIFMVITRFPDLFCIFFQYQGLDKKLDIETLANSSNISEYLEFLFALNGIAQFILFYFFNKNFRESLKNLSNQIKI